MKAKLRTRESVFTNLKSKSTSIFFKKTALILLFISANFFGVQAQNITEIITDYGNYWKSSTAVNNSVKPDNKHNLLSFSYNGKRYSTGVDDNALTTHGDSFIPGDYRALPFYSITGSVNSNTKIGLGASYDGVANGASSPAPLNSISYYLTDGTKGLDLGTCVANLPAGSIYFAVSNIDKQMIGDTIPDVIVTQVADPSGAADKYSFTDINGNRVGNEVAINLNNINALGNWTADFYEASSNPMTLSSGFTKTDRPLRMWAADFKEFGIDSSMISRISYFKIVLNGNSDVAFVGYNFNTINIAASLLPVTLTDFSGKYVNDQVQLQWQTKTEIDNSHFEIELSTDGVNFSGIGTVNAKGGPSDYSFLYASPAGTQYYRLKQVDNNGNYNYSKVIKISVRQNTRVTVYPNPVTDRVFVKHGIVTGNGQLQMINLQGAVVMQKQILSNNIVTALEVQNVPAGIYQLVWKNEGIQYAEKVMVNR